MQASPCHFGTRQKNAALESETRAGFREETQLCFGRVTLENCIAVGKAAEALDHPLVAQRPVQIVVEQYLLVLRSLFAQLLVQLHAERLTVDIFGMLQDERNEHSLDSL
ncbi:hypothetical protein D9M70_545660 [compost metagenome]